MSAGSTEPGLPPGGPLVSLPLESALRAERTALMETMAELTEDDFEHGRTLCRGWAPRDVLAHVLGTESGWPYYLTSFGRLNRANDRIVRASRDRTRADLLARGRGWAQSPSGLSRVSAPLLLGDVAVHHEDVLLPRGISRRRPPAVRSAIFREGVALGRRRLLSHRVIPTDGGVPLGRGRPVRGPAVALGLWLAGREALVHELSFGAR